MLRQINRDLRRPAGPLLDATAVGRGRLGGGGRARSATSTSCRAGPRTRWLALLALTSQVIGWLLISVSLPRLPAALTSVLLLVQPIGAIVLAVLILGEDPSALQLGGTGGDPRRGSAWRR